MILSELSLLLEKLKSLDLPGATAHKEVAPDNRLSLSDTEINTRNPRLAAVVALLYHSDKGPNIILTKRKPYNGVHSSQISFPGGKKEQFDVNFWSCAKRECHEEIGVLVPDNKLIRPLSPIYIPPSNFYVHPFIACLDEKPIYLLDDKEVDYIIDFPLASLLDNETLQMVKIKTHQGMQLNVKAYVHNNEIIWGATAIILSELKFLINELRK
mgnify:CR=1 FL=1